MQVIHNYINGQLVAPQNGQYLDNYNPATGMVYAQVPDSDSNDVEQAYRAAADAFPQWAAKSPDERSQILVKIAELIEANLENLAKAESLDNGKPVALARSVDIPRAATNFRFFAQAITQFSTQAHEMTHAINFTLRQPLGVVGAISPWNLPLYLFTWKIAPALAAGNTVVAKPSEVTPMTAYLLSKLCTEAGLPHGVLNIVHGDGIKVGTAIT
ncbi:MAG: aldehyde dehydrogenase family protein, partial [Bacteroidota bacterium]